MVDAVEALGVGDEQLGVGVVERVADLVARPPAVHADRDRAEAHGRPEGDDPLGRVRAEDRDPVARADAVAVAQGGRHRRHRSEVLGVGDAAVPVDAVLDVAELGRLLEQLPQRSGPVREHGHALAEHVLLDDGEPVGRLAVRADAGRGVVADAGRGARVRGGRGAGVVRHGRGCYGTAGSLYPYMHLVRAARRGPGGQPCAHRSATSFGIEFPIFAFSHCRDVVAAVSRAGGFGVLGALAFTPRAARDRAELDRRARRRQAVRRRHRHAGEVRRQGRRRPTPSFANLDAMIPQQHRDFVEQLLERVRRPAAARRPRRRRDRRPRASDVDEEAPGPGRGVARAPGREAARQRARAAAADVVDHAHEHGAARRRARRQPGSTRSARSTHRRRRDRRPGHRGRRSLRRDLDDGARSPRSSTRSAPTSRCSPPAASATGRQMAAALALGAQGVWTGSIWLTVAEADTSPIVDREAARGDVARHRALARDDRQAGAAAAHRVDRGVRRARGRAGDAADAAAGHPALRRRRAASRASQQPRAHRVPGRSDRRPHERRCARPRT